MGYCPQHDALFEMCTARETLEFYGTIRGIPPAQRASMINFLIERLSLTEYADRPCGTYSGGNKRKLSVAIALISNPAGCAFLRPSSSGKLSNGAALFESNKADLGISNSSLGQTSLEQVFIQFAKKGDHEEFGNSGNEDSRKSHQRG